MPMDVTLSGMVIEESDEQLENADVPIDVTPSGMETDVIEVHS